MLGQMGMNQCAEFVVHRFSSEPMYRTYRFYRQFSIKGVNLSVELLTLGAVGLILLSNAVSTA